MDALHVQAVQLFVSSGVVGLGAQGLQQARFLRVHDVRALYTRGSYARHPGIARVQRHRYRRTGWDTICRRSRLSNTLLAPSAIEASRISRSMASNNAVPSRRDTIAAGMVTGARPCAPPGGIWNAAVPSLLMTTTATAPACCMLPALVSKEHMPRCTSTALPVRDPGPGNSHPDRGDATAMGADRPGERGMEAPNSAATQRTATGGVGCSSLSRRSKHSAARQGIARPTFSA